MLKFSVNHTVDRKNRLMDESKLQKMKKKREISNYAVWISSTNCEKYPQVEVEHNGKQKSVTF
jgi:hypothetical protein